MANQPVHSNQTHTTNRRHFSVATVVVFVIAILVGVALMYSPQWAAHKVIAPEEPGTEIVGETMEASLPTKLRIPTINVEADFEAPLGLEEDGEIEVPKGYETVAYYENGPTPGELGPSVILGHVDSLDGPAVLFSLGQLKVGDQLEIERADGSVAVFAVTEMERELQSGFPTRKVYGDIDHAGLRLITCTGIYDHGSLRYSHNLIVYAKLVSTKKASPQ